MSTNPEPTPTDPTRPRRRPRLLLAAGLVALLGLAGGTAAFVTSSEDVELPIAAGDDEEEVIPATTPEPAADATNEFTTPEEYLGQEVTVAAKVSEVLDAYGFRIKNSTGDELLVVHDGLQKLKEGQLVSVHGTMTEFNKKDVTEALQLGLETIFKVADDDYAIAAIEVKALTGATEKIAQKGQASTVAVATQTTPVIATGGAAVVSSGGSAHIVAGPGDTSSSGSGNTGNGSGSNDGSSGTGNGSGGSHTASTSPTSEIEYTGTVTSGQYSDETEFEATLTDENGRGIRGAKVVFELKQEGASWMSRATTDRNGVATKVKELTRPPGEYKLIAHYRGHGIRDKIDFLIERDDSSLALSVQENTGRDEGAEQNEGEAGSEGQEENGGTLQATLTNDDGSPLAGRIVTFYADGEWVGEATTDGSGIATFEVPSKYKDKNTAFEARFGGDDYYLSSVATQ